MIIRSGKQARDSGLCVKGALSVVLERESLESVVMEMPK